MMLLQYYYWYEILLVYIIVAIIPLCIGTAIYSLLVYLYIYRKGSILSATKLALLILLQNMSSFILTIMLMYLPSSLFDSYVWPLVTIAEFITIPIFYLICKKIAMRKS